LLLSRISRTFTKVVRLNVDIVFRSTTAAAPRGRTLRLVHL
jgi:hypothetical protein